MAVVIRTRPDRFISFQPLLLRPVPPGTDSATFYAMGGITETLTVSESIIAPDRSGSTVIHTEQDELDGRRSWRPARGRLAKRAIENGDSAIGLSPGHRGKINEIGSSAAIQHVPGRAHPGTEGRAMGGFLMVCIMMGFVRDRLGRGEAPDHKNTYNEKTGKKPCNQTVHRNSHCNRTGRGWYWSAAERVKAPAQPEPGVFLVGFVKSLLYTARTILCGRSTSPASNTLMTRRLLLC